MAWRRQKRSMSILQLFVTRSIVLILSIQKVRVSTTLVFLKTTQLFVLIVMKYQRRYHCRKLCRRGLYQSQNSWLKLIQYARNDPSAPITIRRGIHDPQNPRAVSRCDTGVSFARANCACFRLILVASWPYSLPALR